MNERFLPRDTDTSVVSLRDYTLGPNGIVSRDGQIVGWIISGDIKPVMAGIFTGPVQVLAAAHLIVGRSVDVTDYRLEGAGMIAVIWSVTAGEIGDVWLETSEGLGWRVGSDTVVKVLDPTWDSDEMVWAAGARDGNR